MNYSGEIDDVLENAVLCNINSDNKLDAVLPGSTHLKYEPYTYHPEIIASGKINRYLGSGTHHFDVTNNIVFDFGVPYPDDYPSQWNHLEVTGASKKIEPVEVTGEGGNEFKIGYEFYFTFYELPISISHLDTKDLKDYVVGTGTSYSTILVYPQCGK